MLALLLGAVGVVGLVLVGLVLFVQAVLRPADPDAAAATGRSSGTGTGEQSAAAARDELAARAMAQVPDDAALPAPMTARDPGAIVLPPPTRMGAARVATGFPQTPEGALAQLAAIDQTALQAGSLNGAREVITAWALPGGPTAETWSGVHAVASFLGAAGLSSAGSPRMGLVVTPLMGQIKGTVGADFVVPCVDLQVEATLDETARVAAADCQRMVWRGDRWLIGPGPEPAQAPSVWPGTDAAIEVGWRDLRYG